MLLPGGSDVEKIFPEHSTQCQAVVGSLAVACRGRESEGWSTEVSCLMSAATDGDSGFDFCSINNAAKVDRLRERGGLQPTEPHRARRACRGTVS